ncbi:hypothetical protein M9980_03420 [Sphingomonas donggukensis]|uniref:Uncharacterized protein n=1 Tax=Sphingomonas donggukensis TaxID=2949093 RepID=A0ABY4TWP5_9SPHN|nr:hypothetical protein [Sphingomonas donggukensis]URW76285.1 hypothetical protein M9980_03420 [Sphingomonas donggukensis]
MTLDTTSSTSSPPKISRAVNIAASTDQVVAMCAKHDADISAIETLPSGGTRVVLMNAVGAAAIVRAFKSKVLAGDVPRTHWMRVRPSSY